VIVTHHASEAWELATRIGVLVGGQWALDTPRPDDLTAFDQRYQVMARG
jgi:hypothetical protein